MFLDTTKRNYYDIRLICEKIDYDQCIEFYINLEEYINDPQVLEKFNAISKWRECKAIVFVNIIFIIRTMSINFLIMIT